MIAFPNCKINLGLNVIRKRSDNYHDIETVFYPVELKDVLEIISTATNENNFRVTGLPIGDAGDNLCSKAYQLLKADYPGLPYIKLHLHKVIPVAAGLGGGSSDAVFTLKILRDKFLPELGTTGLYGYARQLGSDCPFFLVNKPALATGRGEHLTPIEVDLSSYKIMLVNPAIRIDTAWAYSKINPAGPEVTIGGILSRSADTWKNYLVNDFETPVFSVYPEIKKIKETLYECGAIYASMAGSGSTVYGIFRKNTVIDAKFPDRYFSFVTDLK